MKDRETKGETIMKVQDIRKIETNLNEETNHAIAHCMHCGCKIAKGEGVKAYKKQVGYGFLCKEHAFDEMYSTENDNHIGTKKHSSLAQITIGIELETSYITEDLSNWMISCGWKRTEDASVYREMKSPIMHGLSSISKVFDTIDEAKTNGNIDFTDGINNSRTVGTHLHIAISPELRNALINKTIHKATAGVFENTCSEIIEQMFGRNFTGYARQIDWNCIEKHNNWMNLQHYETLEIRLCKYQNKTQYMNCIKFWRNWVNKAEQMVACNDSAIEYKLAKIAKRYIDKNFR